MTENRTSQVVNDLLAQCKQGNWSGFMVKTGVLEKYKRMEEALAKIKGLKWPDKEKDNVFSAMQTFVEHFAECQTISHDALDFDPLK